MNIFSTKTLDFGEAAECEDTSTSAGRQGVSAGREGAQASASAPVLGSLIVGMMFGIVAAVVALFLDLGYVVAVLVYSAVGSLGSIFCAVLCSIYDGPYGSSVAGSSSATGLAQNSTYVSAVPAPFESKSVSLLGELGTSSVMYVREGVPSVAPEISDYFRRFNAKICVSGSLLTACRSIVTNSSRWKILFLDLDGSDLATEIDAIFESLCELRAVVPFLTVIILSSDMAFEESRFDSEGSSIFDLSGNFPIGGDGDVFNLIREARANNIEWRTRCII